MKKFFISILFMLCIASFTNKADAQTIGEEFAGLFNCADYDLDKTQCPSCHYCYYGHGDNCPVCDDKEDEEKENPNFTTCYCCRLYYPISAHHSCPSICSRCKNCFNWPSAMEEHHCNIWKPYK